MAEVKEHVIYKKNYLDTIGETILNNQQFSDVIFVVNKKHYYACKIVMSAASEVFEALITEHFNNCSDKEVLVSGVKHDESFLNILQYIHGVEINLSLMSKVVLCEMIHLTEEYKLHEIHTDLKRYFSRLQRFKLNSVVVLLNTAKTYKSTVLYEKLKIYVYQHVEQVVKHKSFVNLKYDVLLDILKSDWLYCREIDILRAALNWHEENIMDAETEKMDAETEKENDGKVDEGNLNDDKNQFDDSFQVEVVEEFLSKFSNELCDSENEKDEHTNSHTSENGKENIKVLTQATPHIEIIHVHTSNTIKNVNEIVASSNSNGTDSIEESKSRENAVVETKNMDSKKTKQGVVGLFSGNVLKILLKQIRFERITMFDFHDVMNTDIFAKYKDKILNMRNGLEINEVQRIAYSGCSRKFSIVGISKDSPLKRNYCKESYSNDKFTWKLWVMSLDENGDIISKEKYFGFFLKCTSLEAKWECSPKAIITLISHDPFHENAGLTFQGRTFTQEKPTWGNLISCSKLFNPNNCFIQNDTISFEVNFEFPSLTACSACNAKSAQMI